MRIRHILIIAAILTILIALSGCGSSSEDVSPSVESVTGTFVDDPVEGLVYDCSSGASGVTNADGEYTCALGDDVTFSIGDVLIGTATAQKEMITPYSMFPEDPDAALNLARLLQSVDADGDTQNGVIRLDPLLTALLPKEIDLKSSDFVSSVEALFPTALISADEAQEHLNRVILAAGGEIPVSNDVEVIDEVQGWYRPDMDTSWQWQLLPGEDGSINTDHDADVYLIDLFDPSIDMIRSLHDDGKYVLCHFSGGSHELTDENIDDFPEVALGDLLSEESDERWLDISDPDLRPFMTDRFDLAKEKGCDGVVPDNVDGSSIRNETGIELSHDEQLTYNRWLADQAHERGLAIALMNDLEQIEELEPYFDLSVNEECNYFDECDRLDAFIDAGKPVFHVEYDERYVENTYDYRDRLCAEMEESSFQTLVLPVSLDDSFRITCDQISLLPDHL